VRMLRFLQEKTFERVGGNDTLKVDVRIVAATNRSLKSLVEDGTFREDLYYRLNVVQIAMPPLRARRSDIPVLATFFLQKYAEENEKSIAGISKDAMARLMAQPWPGNVRELENTIERAVVLATGTHIEEADLSTSAPGPNVGGLDMLVPGVTLAEAERLVLERTLEACGGDTAEAAKLLGISRRKIQYRLREWNESEDEHE
jgi:DNA-binding NtrC family response regulator